MNVDRLLHMVIGMVLRPLIQRGVNAGIDRVAGGGKAPAEMTDDERQTAQSTKRTARQAQRAARMARRAGRL